MKKTMKKTMIKSIVLGALVGASILSTHAYNVQIWSPTQYVKQLFVTPNWETDSAKATIVIDWKHGSIKARSLYENGKLVATQEYTNSRANSVLSSAKSYANSRANSVLSSAKSYTNSRANSVLSSAKSYANHIGDTAVSSAKSYANHIGDTAVSSAKSYADKLARGLNNKIQRTKLNAQNLASLWVTFRKCNSSLEGVYDYRGKRCTKLIDATDESHCRAHHATRRGYDGTFHRRDSMKCYDWRILKLRYYRRRSWHRWHRHRKYHFRYERQRWVWYTYKWEWH